MQKANDFLIKLADYVEKEFFKASMLMYNCSETGLAEQGMGGKNVTPIGAYVEGKAFGYGALRKQAMTTTKIPRTDDMRKIEEFVQALLEAEQTALSFAETGKVDGGDILESPSSNYHWGKRDAIRDVIRKTTDAYGMKYPGLSGDSGMLVHDAILIRHLLKMQGSHEEMHYVYNPEIMAFLEKEKMELQLIEGKTS